MTDMASFRRGLFCLITVVGDRTAFKVTVNVDDDVNDSDVKEVRLRPGEKTVPGGVVKIMVSIGHGLESPPKIAATPRYGGFSF
jgi:hypothetical protein